MTRPVTGLALSLAALIASANAYAAPASLPAVEHTLVAGSAAQRTCPNLAPAHARGVATTRYRAPMSGYVTVNLAAPDSSDWDLAVFDAATRHRVAASSAFGSHEVAESWAQAGDRFIVQGCLRKGSAHKAAVSIRFVDVKPPKFDGIAKQVTVFVHGQDDVNRLDAIGLDVTHDMMPGQVDALVLGQKQLNALDATGLKYRTRISDLEKSSARARSADARAAAGADPSPLPTGRSSYRTLEDYQAELKKIADTYGPQGLVRPITIGKTLEGRPIQGLEIADNVNATDDGRPTYVVVAMHHAREWPSAEAAMEFAWMLVSGNGLDDNVTSLLQRERIIVIPILNIDGFVVSRTDSAFSPNDIGNSNGIFTPGEDPGETVHTGEAVLPGGPPAAYRRKNCRGLFPNGAGFPCELQYGVDPNRNYGNGWGGPGASSDPSSQTFRGDGPWSEPETNAFWHFSQKRPITALITLHNVAALVLRPPGLSSAGFAPDEDAMKKLGDAMADDTGYTSEFGWQLYDTSGTTEDWNYAAQGTFGYTIEMGPEGGQFHMDYKTGVIDQWTGTKGRAGLRHALLLAGEAGASAADQSVVSGHAPAGRVLRLHKSFKTSTGKVCQLADPSIESGICENPGDAQQIDDQLDYARTVPSSGSYTWMVPPSTRPFVGEKREIGEQTKVGEQKVDGTMPADGSRAVVPFTIDRADLFRETIDLTWDPGCATDLDLYIYWHDPVTNEWRQVASSGNAAGSCEQAVLIQPRTGEYRAEVDLFASPPATPYHIDRIDYTGGIKVTPGHTEAYTMTCETPDGKVLETKDVTVGRGETANVDFACGASGGAVKGTKKKHRLSKRVACLRKANHIKGKHKRAKAVKRCRAKYPAHHKAHKKK